MKLSNLQCIRVENDTGVKTFTFTEPKSEKTYRVVGINEFKKGESYSIEFDEIEDGDLIMGVNVIDTIKE
jgi:hypothetical protein